MWLKPVPVSAVCLCLCLCLLAGCNSADTDERQSQTSGVNRQQEERAIRDLETRWRDVVANDDTAAIAAFYTEDAIYSPNGRPPFRGRDSVVWRWSREFAETADFKLERTPIRIEIANSGDLASEVGTCDVEFRVKGKLHRPTCGYMTTWRKAEGQWKIASYIWNEGKSEREP
jgi:ketosteroid isomerase-like protein